MPMPSDQLLAFAKIAALAGRAIMQIYDSSFSARFKADNSPVTEADQVAEDIIIEELNKLDLRLPIVAEEQAASGLEIAPGNAFYLVDPLDGTKEFISRNGEFTVNIARVENGVPAAGVIYAPALGELYLGELGLGAFHKPDGQSGFTSISARKIPEAGATVLASRSHADEKTDRFIAALKVDKRVNAGSSLKFCRIAAGEADIYPRFGRTMEWDTAAGQAILAAAGGSVTEVDGKPLLYGKSSLGFVNPPFIARGQA